MCRPLTGCWDMHETAWLMRTRLTAAVLRPINSHEHRPSTRPGSFRLVATTRIKLPAHLPHSNNINTPIASPSFLTGPSSLLEEVFSRLAAHR